MIEVRERERSPVFHEIQSCGGGDIRERSITIVGVENVALVAAPGAVGADKFIDSIPSLLVFFVGNGPIR